MKKTLLLLALLLSLAVPAKAQLGSDQIQDIDAYEYIRINNVEDAQAIKDINAWFLGLKYLQLHTNVLYMADFRSHHGAFQFGTTYPEGNGNDFYIVTTNNQPVAPMMGTNAVSLALGTFQVTSRGLQFTNNVNQSIQVTNVFGSTFTAGGSMVAVGLFKNTGASTAVWGGYQGSSTRGPQLFAHGSPSAGAGANRLYQNLSGNGSTNVNASTSLAGLVGSGLIPTTKSVMAISTFSPTEVKITGNVNIPYASTGTYESSIYNGGTYWYVGKTGDGALPISGEVSAVILFNKPLCYTEMAAIRRLYQVTIGRGILPDNIIHFEGDSLTAGSGVATYWVSYLDNDTGFGPGYMGRTMATGGETTIQMFSQQVTNLYPFNVEFGFVKKQYFFIYGGINDCDAGELAENIYFRLKTMWARAKERGYIVVAFTTTGSESLTAGEESQRVRLNSMIRNSVGLWDKLVDLDSVGSLKPAGSTLNSTMYLDAAHYTTAGHAVIAEEIKRTISRP